MINYLTKFELEKARQYLNGTSYLYRYYTLDEFKLIVKDTIFDTDCDSEEYNLEETLRELVEYKDNDNYIYVDDWGKLYEYEVGIYATVDNDELMYYRLFDTINETDENTILLEIDIEDIHYTLEYNSIINCFVVSAIKNMDEDFYKECSCQFRELYYNEALEMVREVHNGYDIS